MVGIATPFLDFTGANETQDPPGTIERGPLAGRKNRIVSVIRSRIRRSLPPPNGRKGYLTKKKAGLSAPPFLSTYFGPSNAGSIFLPIAATHVALLATTARLP
jgi:hypothetical protein